MASGHLPEFGSLIINENATGWGPMDIPPNFKEMPYQPFSKDTRIGRRGRRGAGGGYAGSRGGYFAPQNAFGNRKSRPGGDRDRRWGASGGRGGAQSRVSGPNQSWRNATGGAWYQDRRPVNRIIRESSVQIEDSWKLEEELDFSRLSKLTLPLARDPEDLVKCGEMEYYDKSYDKVSTRNERLLSRIDRVMHTVTSNSDPVLARLASSGVGKVFCTDTIAATIMCCTRSVYPWDLVVTRIGDILFIDERENSDFNMVTVCETAAEPPNGDLGHINSAPLLALEATFINTNLCQQMLLMGGKKYAFPEPNPFIDEDDDSGDGSSDNEEEKRPRGKQELGSAGYRYRKFDLGNNIDLVVRCKLDGVQHPVGYSDSPQFICIRALNEFDPRYCGGVDWRSKLDTQRGAVLASEIKNNAFKLARWAVCSVLAGADQLKLGFVSRVNPKDTGSHVILATQQFKPFDFTAQLNLNLANCWGILRCVVDFFMRRPSGRYVLMKDPNRSLLRIYSVPVDMNTGSCSEAESTGGAGVSTRSSTGPPKDAPTATSGGK